MAADAHVGSFQTRLAFILSVACLAMLFALSTPVAAQDASDSKATPEPVAPPSPLLAEYDVAFSIIKHLSRIEAPIFKSMHIEQMIKQYQAERISIRKLINITAPNNKEAKEAFTLINKIISKLESCKKGCKPREALDEIERYKIEIMNNIDVMMRSR